MKLVAWMLALVMGCDGRTALQVDDDPGGEGCTRDADCDGGWCAGPTACGSVWSCVDEVPCSAAAPSWVCGCDGRIFSAAAGCPERQFGWSDPEETLPLVGGEPCDPSDREGFRLDVNLRGAGFAAQDGRLVEARLYDPADGEIAAQWRTQVREGNFEFIWPGGLDPAFAMTTAEVFIVDDEGTCVAELAWRVNIERGAEPIEVRVSLGQTPTAEICN